MTTTANEVVPFLRQHALKSWASSIEQMLDSMPGQPTDNELRWLLPLNAAAVMIRNLDRPDDGYLWRNMLTEWAVFASRRARNAVNPTIEELCLIERTLDGVLLIEKSFRCDWITELENDEFGLEGN